MAGLFLATHPLLTLLSLADPHLAVGEAEVVCVYGNRPDIILSESSPAARRLRS